MKSKDLKWMLDTARTPVREGLPVRLTHRDGQHVVEFVSSDNGTQRLTIQRRDNKPDVDIVSAILAAWPELIPDDTPRVERTQGKLYTLTLIWPRVMSVDSETA